MQVLPLFTPQECVLPQRPLVAVDHSNLNTQDVWWVLATACVASSSGRPLPAWLVSSCRASHPGWPLPAWLVSTCSPCTQDGLCQPGRCPAVDCAGPHHVSERSSEPLEPWRSEAPAARPLGAQRSLRGVAWAALDPCPSGQACPPGVRAAGHSKPCRLPLERQAVAALVLQGWLEDSHRVASSACSRIAWPSRLACPSGLIAAPYIRALMPVAALLRSSCSVGLHT